MKVKLVWHEYRYFPYERKFALAEVQSILGATTIEETTDGLTVLANTSSRQHAKRLTYFASAHFPDGHVVIPDQAKLEASCSSTHGNRQATRYSAHGLHEYKGKFNPQVVRAIGNRLALNAGSNVLDPFSGSGTTLLEAAHVGWNAIGVDRNPLAVMISNAKIRALQLAGGPLNEYVDKITSKFHSWSAVLENGAPSCQEIDLSLGKDWHRDLPADEYLQSWFPTPVLAQVVAIRRALQDVVPCANDRRIFEVLVSDQLRECSFQEPADLRIRRRKEPAPNYSLISKSLHAISEHSRRVTRAMNIIGTISTVQKALLGDVRQDITNLGEVQPNMFDAIICSPPYATALPYIDTQRLSLVMFGLIEPAEIKPTESALVGAREIGSVARRELELELTMNPDPGLPKQIVSVCRDMLLAAKQPGNGFRRRNTPSLVYRYFKDMALFFRSTQPTLRPGATAALVVGANRTTLGGKLFNINTPQLIAELAKKSGFVNVKCESMDTYQRYDLHQKNSIDNEMLILAQRPTRSARPTKLERGSSNETAKVLVSNEAIALPLVSHKRHSNFVKRTKTDVIGTDNAQLELRF